MPYKEKENCTYCRTCLVGYLRFGHMNIIIYSLGHGHMYRHIICTQQLYEQKEFHEFL